MLRNDVLAVCVVFLAGCRQEVAEIAPTALSVDSSDVQIVVDDSDWPWWRGPLRDGHATGPLPPTAWDGEANIVWKAKIPGRGHASPIVWGDQIFLATADATAETLSLLSVSRADGRLRWQSEIHQGDLGDKHAKNSYASATPACDGTRVFGVFAFDERLWVTATDLSGAIQWQTDVGPFLADHGYGSAPVIAGNMIYVLGDSRGSGFLAALDRASGKIVWRRSRPRNDSYSTPVVANLGSAEQLLVNGQGQLTSYDLQTGATVWAAEAPAATTANTPVWDDLSVVVSGGFPSRGVYRISADQRESSAEHETLWKKDFKAYVPSSIVVENRLVVPLDTGIVMCFDLETGKELWKHRLGGDITASPVLIDGHLFLSNELGETFVFRATDKFELIAKNKLPERIMASPAICGGRLYLRTDSELYCIGSKATRSEAEISAR